MAQAIPKAKLYEQDGPYGSKANPTFKLMLDKSDRITVVNIRSGSIVDGIGFEIVGHCGNTPKTWYFGGSGGSLHSIPLKCGERVTQISGQYADWSYTKVTQIVSIKIHTNLAPEGYGPYGLAENCTNIKSFKTVGPSVGPIVGFLGASGQFLDSVGVYYEKILSLGQTLIVGLSGEQDYKTRVGLVGKRN